VGRRAVSTFEDIWWVELVWVSLFSNRHLFADLKKSGPGGEVGDATGHNHEQLGSRQPLVLEQSKY